MIEVTSWSDQILIYMAFALALNLLIGYAGVFMVAPAVFGSFGAYSVSLLYLHFKIPLGESLLIGCVLSVVVACIMGLPAFRLNLLWVILLTLGVQEVVTGLLSSVPAFGGSYGFSLATDNLSLFGISGMTNSGVFWFALVLAILTFGFCWRVGESPYGRVLRAMRDDELAVRSLGRHPFAYKLTTMVFAAIVAALAGALLGLVFGATQPSLFSFTASIAMVAMVIIGGRGSLVGTVVAAVLVELIAPFLEYVIKINARDAALLEVLLYGALLVLIIYLRPNGLIPEGVLPRRRLRVQRSPAMSLEAQPMPVPGGLVPALSTLGSFGGADDVSGVSTWSAGAARLPGIRPVVIAPASHQIPGAGSARGTATAERVEGPAVGEGDGHWSDNVLEARDLAKSFGGVTAVNGLSFDLRRGAITALVGPNGAGKTTVFNLLTGTIPLDRGKVSLNGEDITGLRPDVIAHKGMVRSFQDVKLFIDLTAYENVLVGIQGHPGELFRGLFLEPRRSSRFEREAHERALEWLEFVGMADKANDRARSLAFGEQKLVAMARVLATEAEVLLLDEPASGIDHAWVETTLGLIEQLRAAGKTICIVEHNLHVVGRLADHVYFMEVGRVTAEGGFAELTANPRLAEAYFGTE